MDPITKFVIFGFGRSGSTLLKQLLNSHPLITCMEEMLWEKLFGAGMSNETFFAEVPGYLETKVWSCPKNSATKAIGFKLLVPQIRKNPHYFSEYFVEHDVHIVHLIRRNTLDWLLSLKLSGKQQNWFGQQYSDELKVRIKPEELINGVAHHKRIQSDFDVYFAKLPNTTVYYEDVCHEQRLTMIKLCEFLGIPYRWSNTHMVKQRVKKREHHVLEYEALKNHFKGTEYEELFKEEEQRSITPPPMFL